MNLIGFAVLAGAVQMIAPDRWMSVSILTWQRGWQFARTVGFLLLIYSVHVLMGIGLYLGLFHFTSFVPEEFLGAFTLIFLGAVGIIRIIRLDRIREIVHRDRGSRGAILTLMSLLGPSEFIIPIAMRAHLDGHSTLPVFMGFWLGSFLVGVVSVTVARAFWNRPLVLPRVFEWSLSRQATFPIALSAVLGSLLMVIRVIG